MPRLHAGLRRHGRHEEALRLATPRPARPQRPSGGRACADGQTPDSRWSSPPRRGDDLGCQERRATGAVRSAPLPDAAHAGQRAAAAGREHHAQAAAQHGRARRAVGCGSGPGAHRCVDRHVAAGTLRAGEDHACGDPGAGAAAGALRRSHRLAAGRLRHRLAPGGPAHPGPEGDGRRHPCRARLHPGQGQTSEGRLDHHRHGDGHRHREPDDGRHAGRG